MSNAASKIARKAWLALLVGLIADTYRLLERSLIPIAELLILAGDHIYKMGYGKMLASRC